jgi:uncharacterized membrane protein
MSTKRERIIDLVLGLVGGAVVGAIVAVNLVVGIITTGILVAGPILGVALMKKLRNRNRPTA